MPRKITIILLCSVAIVVAELFTVTQLMAQPEALDIIKYQAIASTNEIKVAGLLKRYTRDENGCVDKVEFWNEPAKCFKNNDCLRYLNQEWEKCNKDNSCQPKLKGITWPPATEPGWEDAIEAAVIGSKNWPQIWGEYLVGAGSTKGESGSDVCVEWRFTVAGSPGWDCDYIGDRIVCSCIGYYYEPLEFCCQPSSSPPYFICNSSPW